MCQIIICRPRILLAGNGGSAADAQHIAAEFVSRFMYDRPGLPAIALTTDTSMLTAIGNDYGFEKLFQRQFEANARKGDIFIGITPSGNSPNVLLALELCRELGVTSVGLSGIEEKFNQCATTSLQYLLIPQLVYRKLTSQLVTSFVVWWSQPCFPFLYNYVIFIYARNKPSSYSRRWPRHKARFANRRNSKAIAGCGRAAFPELHY